ASDGLFVPLQGPSVRYLGRPAQFLEQAPDVGLVVADAELVLDDPGDASASPDLSAEAVGLRPVPEEFGDQPFLRVGELGRAARCRTGEQGPGAAIAAASEPTTDGLFGDVQGL